MIKITSRIALLTILLCQINMYCQAQLSPINFETNGYGATWTWTTFENASNPTPVVMTNPFPGGINTSDNVIQFTALQTGQPWAGFESLHGAGIGTFTLDSSNSIIKLMVYKSVISDVGVKLVTPPGGSTGELKVANTLINQWEELTFDFTSQIGHPQMIGLDQIVIFPDFDLAGRTGDHVCFIDNIKLGNNSTPLSNNFFTESNYKIHLGKNKIRIESNMQTKFDELEIYDLFGKKIFEVNRTFNTNQNITVRLKNNTYYIIRVRKGTKFITESAMIIE